MGNPLRGLRGIARPCPSSRAHARSRVDHHSAGGQQIAPTTPDPARKRGLSLTIAGFSLFFATYALPAAVSTELYPEVGRPLLIPLVGPFISASRFDNPGGSVLSALFGVFQATGLSMGIAGAVIFGKARRRARVSADLGGLQVQF